MALDPEMERWLRRLPLAERIELERREAQQDAYRMPITRSRCSVCGGRIKADGVIDLLKRCLRCRDQGRRPHRPLPRRSTLRGPRLR
jgi:tRNA(Ile2) C34 agmatinyltransferase TiaS